ncbi:MAG: MFS transporter [Actinobacteria bacterium]|nr:MFS transporter [Actinomycetota bacterium]
MPAVLLIGDFRRLWLASTIAALGDYFRLFAIPLLVFALTGSALTTGATLALETVPYLIVSPVAGALTDRFGRRHVMLTCRVIQAVLVGSLPATFYGGVMSLPQTYAVALLTGGVEVVYGAASLSGVPALVGRESLVTANSALQMSLSVSALVGPPLAGAVSGATGQPAAALAMDAGAQLAAALVLFRVGVPMLPDRSAAQAISLVRDIREGLAYMARHPLLRTTAVVLFTFNVVLGGTLGQLVVYGRVELGLRSLPLSLLYSGEGFGAIIGAILAPRIGRRWPLGRIVLAALPVSACSVLILSLAANLPEAFAALALLGLAETVMFVNLIALRQRIVPDHMQGRVNATARALAVSGVPVGAVVLGALVGPLGIRRSLALLAVAALANAVGAAFTSLRSDTASHLATESTAR